MMIKASKAEGHPLVSLNAVHWEQRTVCKVAHEGQNPRAQLKRLAHGELTEFRKHDSPPLIRRYAALLSRERLIHSF